MWQNTVQTLCIEVKGYAYKRFTEILAKFKNFNFYIYFISLIQFLNIQIIFSLLQICI